MTEVRVLARRGRDRKDIMWCVESDASLGIDKTREIIETTRGVEREKLDYRGWTEIRTTEVAV